MKKILLLLIVSLLLAGCGKENEESMQEEVKKGEAEEEIDESEKLFHQFLNNEIAAYGKSGELLFYRDLCEEYFEILDAEGSESNTEPTFYDLDNDGVDELIMNWFWGWYGGYYFDARDGRVYLFAEGEGTAGMLSYTDYKGSAWIYHYDVSHGGREMFWFERYQGADCMVESFSLYDEFWEGKEHTYSLNEEEISMEEYITLYEEIFQHGYSPRNY